MDMIAKERKQNKIRTISLCGRVMAVCLMFFRYLMGLPPCRKLTSCQAPTFCKRSGDPAKGRKAPYLRLPAACGGRSRASPPEANPFTPCAVP